MGLAPIAVFAYNRPENLGRMFHSLMQCEGFAESQVVVFVDGPKNAAAAPKVAQAAELVRSLRIPGLQLVERPVNLGLKESIYQGVGQVCAEHGRAIVLEDDLLLSSRALVYFNNALDKYQDDPRVWSVVGYQYQVPELARLDRALVLPFTHTWGWATWRRAWERYDMHAPIDTAALRSPAFHEAFDAHGVRDFRNMLELALAGKVQCWFTPWYYKIFSERGLSIFPPRAYVTNTGIRRGGTHSTILNPYYLLVRKDPPWEGDCTLPDELVLDYWAMDAIAKSWDARVQKFISHLGRIKRLMQG